MVKLRRLSQIMLDEENQLNMFKTGDDLTAAEKSALSKVDSFIAKAGSLLNLIRWVSARTIKENFVPPRDYSYPFMAEQ